MNVNIMDLITRRQKLWGEWVALNLKAQETMDLEDGIAAGRAYKAFMDDFLAPAQRVDLEAIKFPNRRRS